MELGLFPMMLLIIVLIHCGQTQDYTPSAAVEDDSQDALPEATLTMWPENPVFTGESVTLKCEVKGFNGWTYEWYKRNKVKDSWTQVSQSESYRLNISEDAVVNNDQYRCRGMRYHKPSTTQYSEPASIITKALPRVSITVNPQGTVFAGESVTLKCAVKDDNDGWTHQWYKWNELKQWIALLQSVNYTINKDTLTISKHTVLNGEQYGCRVERHDRPKTLQNSSVTLTAKVKPKPELTSSLRASALIGNPVILYCKLKSSAGWSFYWSRHTQSPENETNTTTSSYTISSVLPSDGGQYWCRAGRGNPVYYTNYSDAFLVKVIEGPKPVVIIEPNKPVFRGETVTLSCHIEGGGDSTWTYSWYKNDRKFSSCSTSPQCKISSDMEADGGKYTCRGQRSDSQSSKTSDALTLILSSAAQVVLNVSTQSWLTEGDSVALSCGVRDSTDWTFSWYRDNQELLSDSSRGAGGSYTISSVAFNHTGVYVCRAERGKPEYRTQYSNPQPIWITGRFPQVFLIISPSKSQHFSGDSLSLSCEDQSGSSGWRVKRFTHTRRVSDCSAGWGSVTGSTCTISSLSTSHTGVYWCQSESGGSSNPANITVEVSGVSNIQPALSMFIITLPASLFLLVPR